MIIRTDRSRIETLEHCYRKRYWQYEYQGRGLSRTDELMLDARIGTWVHGGIERRFVGWVEGQMTDDVATIAHWAETKFIEDCMSVIDWSQATEQTKHDVSEGGQIVKALVYAWLRTKAHQLINDGEVLAIEKELTVDFPMGADIVRLMARPDIIWRRNADGGIFIRNLKTVRKADDRWREKWALDMQTLSEPLTIDEWMFSNASGQPDDRCAGVIIDGLVTGEVLFDKYRGFYYHNNPLIYAWVREGDPPFGENEFYSRYEWSCTMPHKLGNGRHCEGGKTHKLGSGVKKVPVAERYPGGVIAWVDHLIESDTSLVEECIIELPPIIRSEYQISRWKRQVLPRELTIHNKAHLVNEDRENGYSAFSELLLDENFPMSTAGGNCLYPGKCMAYNLCYGSAASDPLNSGYQFRIANHPQEEMKGE